MKKIIIILGLVVTTFSSCSDNIEEKSLSTVSADETYKTAAGFQLLVNSNYAAQKNIYGGVPWLFCSGTDMYAEGRVAEPAGLSQYIQLIPSATGVEQLYQSCYQVIQSVNKTIYYSAITEQNANIATLVGEAKFIRANAYFLLVQTYGGVPIVDENITSAVLSFNRNSAQEVYTHIIKNLEESLATVGTTAYASSGKVNKRAVQDLLAKVYLTRGYETFGSSADFTASATYADAAIAGQALNLPYADLFKVNTTTNNDLNAETIYSIQYDKTSTSTDPTTLGNNQFYYFGPYLGGSETNGAPLRSYNLLPTSYALSLFEKGDTRWNATFMTEIFEYTKTVSGKATTYLYNPYYDASIPAADLKVRHFYEPKWFTVADKTAYLATAKLATGFVYHPWGDYDAAHTLIDNRDCYTIPVKKFDDPTPTTPNTAGNVSTRDIIVSRLGETYLIAAEAYLKAGNPGTGLARLNEVRRRAGVVAATAGQFNIDYILDERGRELLGEYKRWFDLKRTGTLISRASAHNYRIKAANFDGLNGEKKILRPIPQLALDLNQNKSFPQNPAY